MHLKMNLFLQVILLGLYANGVLSVSIFPFKFCTPHLVSVNKTKKI